MITNLICLGLGIVLGVAGFIVWFMYELAKSWGQH